MHVVQELKVHRQVLVFEFGKRPVFLAIKNTFVIYISKKSNII